MNKDIIYRQDAIDILYNFAGCIVDTPNGDYCRAYKASRYKLETLPSAQPEIIRCTECKHYREYDSEYVENAVVVQCMADRYPISETIPDGWFCAGAEKKGDGGHGR